MNKKNKNGFTLIELMVIVAVIGLLAYIVSTKMGAILTKAREGTVKADLGSIRSALTIYYSDNISLFPSDTIGNNQTVLTDALVPKYIGKIPSLEVYPYHAVTNVVETTSNGIITEDDGEWSYASDSSNSNWGTLSVECTHTDSKGEIWSSY